MMANFNLHTFVLNKILNAFEIQVNHLISLDPLATHLLKKVSGKILAIDISQPKLTFSILFCDDSIVLLNQCEKDAQIYLNGSLYMLAQLALNPKTPPANFGIKAMGDLEALHHIQTLMTELEPDWEEKLSQFIGDSAAHQSGKFLKIGRQFLRDNTDKIFKQGQHYAKQTGQAWLSPEELHDHFNQVEQVKIDSDRLALKVQRLNHIINPPASPSAIETSPVNTKADT